MPPELRFARAQMHVAEAHRRDPIDSATATLMWGTSGLLAGPGRRLSVRPPQQPDECLVRCLRVVWDAFELA
jgi:hypothetical protein